MPKIKQNNTENSPTEVQVFLCMVIFFDLEGDVKVISDITRTFTVHNMLVVSHDKLFESTIMVVVNQHCLNMSIPPDK